MVKGLNHITLAVRDLEESCSFYQDVLRCRLIARWDSGAYLVAGDVWGALVLDPKTRPEALPDYTHIAVSINDDDFPVVSKRIRDSGARIWKVNESEGPSLDFEDPTGHKLEVHVGALQARLADARQNPWPCLEILDSDV